MQPRVVVIGAEKSVAVAVLLSFFLGPLGMLYSTGLGAIVMFLANLVIVPATLGVGLLLTIPAGMIWAGSAASAHNQRLRQPLLTA